MQAKVDLTNKISVVIITRNRARLVLNTLQHLQQLPEAFPICVVDNHSTDNTVAQIKKFYPEVNVIALSRNQGAVGRNIGLQATTTPFVAFCDDDSWWEPGAISRAVEYFGQYPDVGLIAGKIAVKDQRKLDPISAMQSSSPLTAYVSMPGPAILGFLACGVMVRKKAFMEVRGYNKHIFFSGEEELLGIDLAANGWGLTYCEDIGGRHCPSPRGSDAARLRLSIRNRVQVALMRRPWNRVLLIIFKLSKQAARDWNVAIGLIMGIVQIPIALQNRQVIPWWIEQQIELLEDHDEQLANRETQKQRRLVARQLESS